MLTLLKHRLRRLRSQLILIFLVGFPGIGLAIGLPVLLLLSQQSSSHAQRLLDQAVIASRAFLEGETSDLQSLALLVSQRPTLMQLLNDQEFSSLEGYLNTLRESVDLDLLLICSTGEELAGTGVDGAGTEICRVDAQSGYASIGSGSAVYLYATGDIVSNQGASYRVIIGKRASAILAELQQETGLLYFIIWQDQLLSSDPSLEITPKLRDDLLRGAARNRDGSLQQRASPFNEHRYILSDLALDPSVRLISALDVDDLIAVQQRSSRSLMFGLFLIVLIATALGVWLSQRLSGPIVRLANAAAEFRQGNLDSPISVQSSVWEIDQLSNTLEDGRIALRHSLQQLQAEKAWIEH